MSNLAAIYTTIRTRVQDEVVDSLGYAVQFDNMAPITKGSFWVRLTILPGESEQVTRGSQVRVRHVGEVIFTIFATKDTGDGAVLTAVDAIKDLFKHATYSGVTFRSPFASRLGREDSWWGMNLHCPFYSDEIN